MLKEALARDTILRANEKLAKGPEELPTNIKALATTRGHTQGLRDANVGRIQDTAMSAASGIPKGLMAHSGSQASTGRQHNQNYNNEKALGGGKSFLENDIAKSMANPVKGVVQPGQFAKHYGRGHSGIDGALRGAKPIQQPKPAAVASYMPGKAGGSTSRF